MEEQYRRSDVFEACYCQHRRAVYCVALRLVGNHAEAEDIAQQVFLRFWNKPQAFRGGNLAAWLTTLAHNLSVDALRRRRDVFLGDMLPEAINRRSECDYSPEDEVIRELTAACVRGAFGALDHKEQLLVYAAFVEEQSHSQIAKAHALPLGTVKTRIRTGLRRMRPTTTGVR